MATMEIMEKDTMEIVITQKEMLIMERRNMMMMMKIMLIIIYTMKLKLEKRKKLLPRK